MYARYMHILHSMYRLNYLVSLNTLGPSLLASQFLSNGSCFSSAQLAAGPDSVCVMLACQYPAVPNLADILTS